jgi:hypothetical protein
MPCHCRKRAVPGTYVQRQYRKMTNSSILTISALFTLAYLSTLPPSCGFGDVILLPFAVWIIWLKRLFSSTASRARGQSYYAVRSFPAPFEPQSFWRRRQFAPVAVRLQTERSARSPNASPSASSFSLSASSRALEILSLFECRQMSLVEPARPSRIARSSSFLRLQAPKAQAPFRCRTALRHRPLQECVLSRHRFGPSADRHRR